MDKGEGEHTPAQRSQDELNPLLNPLLERNLGRWAQVYFTTPREKREQAVRELLVELGGDTSPPASVGNTSVEAPAARPQAPDGVQCPACHRANPMIQRYCGHCGSQLRPGNQNLPRGSRANQAVESHDDVEWQRDRTLRGFEEYEEPRSGVGKYLAVALLILLAGFVYLRRGSAPQPVASGSASAVPSPSTAAQSRPETPPAPPVGAQPLPGEQAPTAPSPPTSPTDGASAAVIPAMPKDHETPSERTMGVTPTSVRHELPQSPGLTSFPSRRASEATESGAQELLFAKRYLEGKDGPRDSVEAAKWLWRAVAKQNREAGLLLADLYMRGDGVAKSCDQARLLLVAAAKKGVGEAAGRLRSLETSGCQ